MSTLRRFAMWLVWNVPLGALAPHVMAFALGAESYQQVKTIEGRDPREKVVALKVNSATEGSRK